MKRFLLISLALVFVFVFSAMVLAAGPSGASLVGGSNETAPADSPDANSAFAGNITELTITGYSTTQTWQGYFGNVTGIIQLADASDNVLYNWSLSDPEGEVYASNASSIAWASIACYNVDTDSLGIESSYNIGATDVDGLNETFAVNNHDAFYTNSVEFTENECSSVQLYDDTGASVDQHFEEVVLTDAANIIFASLLEDASVDGFDQADHDFEMLVLEDGHDGDVSTTTYYFYVELE
ncbi:MAG: hypothetical protein PVJ67_03050 [Candidatus Pacearchaeota archaeon]|jgi:hypothetical protein